MKAETIEQEFALHMPTIHKPWFEGWYIRITSKDVSLAVSIGLRAGTTGNSAFIQTLDTRTQRSRYTSYTMDEVYIDQAPYTIHIKDNTFSMNHLSLRLPYLQGEISMRNFFPLKGNLYAPTIMGPFAYYKNMQCIHSVISMYHEVQGSLRIDTTAYQIFGRGYMEKDRGTSFPSHYIWFQSNTCREVYSGFFLSIAHIPLSKISFKGCICVLMNQGKQLRFATYLGCRVRKIQDKNIYILTQFPYKLYVKIVPGKGCTLKAPHKGEMNEEVEETLQAKAHVILYRYHQKLQDMIFTHGGYEKR